MVRLTQKTFETKDETPKTIAYVRAEICVGGHVFPVTIPDRYGDHKTNYNQYCRSLGFIVGEVADPSTVPEKVVEK